METTSDSRKGSGGDFSDYSPRSDSYATAMESDGHDTTSSSAATVSTGPRPWPSSGFPPLPRPKSVQPLDASEVGHSSRCSSMFRRNESRTSNPGAAAAVPYSVVAQRSRRQLRSPTNTGRGGSLESQSTGREGFISIDGNLGLSHITLRSDPGSRECLSIYLSYHSQEAPETDLEVRSATSNLHRRSECEKKSRGKESRGAASWVSDMSRNREEWDNACPAVGKTSKTGVREKVASPHVASRSFIHYPSPVPFNVPNYRRDNELGEKPSFFRDSPFARRLRSFVRGNGKHQESEPERNRCWQSDEKQGFASKVAASCRRCNARRATKPCIENEYVHPDHHQPNVPLPTACQIKDAASNLFANESARYEVTKQSLHQSKATARNLSREAKHDESESYVDMRQSMMYKISFPCQNEGNNRSAVDSFHRLTNDLYGTRLTPVNLDDTFTSAPLTLAPEPKLPLPISRNDKRGSGLVCRKPWCRRKSQNQITEALGCRATRRDLLNNENAAHSSELEMEATFQRRDREGDEYVEGWECGNTPERRTEDELLTCGGIERETSECSSEEPKKKWFGWRQESVRCQRLSRSVDSFMPEDTYMYPGNWNDTERSHIGRSHIGRSHIDTSSAERSLSGKKSHKNVAASGPLKKASGLYPEVHELPVSLHGRRRLSSSPKEVLPLYEEIDHPRKGCAVPLQRKMKKKTGIETRERGNSFGRRFLDLMERLRRSVSKRKKSTGHDGKREFEL